jgi:hypothetical protein
MDGALWFGLGLSLGILLGVAGTIIWAVVFS